MAMKVKYHTAKDDFPKIEKAVNALSGREVIVGCLEGEHAWLAGIHEYGCKIPVTPKMRAYLRGLGIHLKKSTTSITIPERSFIRAGHDQYAKQVLDSAEKALPAVLSGTMSDETYLKMVGELMAGKIKRYAIDLKDPPNSGMTVKLKGSSNPLVGKGSDEVSMINGITYEVKR